MMIMMIREALLVMSIAAQAAAPAPPPYVVSVTDTDGFIELAVKAKDAALADVATELSKQLHARVVVSPSLDKETISSNRR
jgi:type II secretory pathway component GspD/PulD (secretin)